MLDSCRVLESEGTEVTYLPVGKNGIIELTVSSLPPSLPPSLPLSLPDSCE